MSPSLRAWRMACACLLVAWIGAGCGEGRSLEPGTVSGATRPPALARATAQGQDAAHQALAEGRAAPGVILFGDLHVHTQYSWDAFLLSLPLAGSPGANPPADACDFARYCAGLDFFALTDHAETLPTHLWQNELGSLKQCNERAGDPADPDVVAFAGFEWSQVGSTAEEHYGHRCVVFRDPDPAALPARAIGSLPPADDPAYALRGPDRARNVKALASGMAWIDPWNRAAYADLDAYLDDLLAWEPCPEGVDSRSLPATCRENAATPAVLYEKLSQWGSEALVIPHGTAWGTYTPATAAWDHQLDSSDHDPALQRLVEIHSGHGNSESYRPWRAVDVDAEGRRVCPAPRDDFLPCCWQAGEIMRKRCGDLPADECERRVELARQVAAQWPIQPWRTFPDSHPAEWLDCDQCRDCFKPSFALRPTESVQYALALSQDGDSGEPQRFRFGFIGSSDNHAANPGVGYKQLFRRGHTTDGGGVESALVRWILARRQRMDDPQQPQGPVVEANAIVGNDGRVTSFLYPSGLVAVHARGRDRASIWEALTQRSVYATSGPRILLWFDLLDGGDERVPMGGEVRRSAEPEFEVRAVGAQIQQPGCPTWSGGLPAERLAALCRDECHHPGDARHRIAGLEVVRIRPQRHAGEPVDALIEDPWRTFPCPPDRAGCVVRFRDPDFAASERDAVYYVRALQEATPAINGDPLRPERDADGRVVRTTPCDGPDGPGGECLAPTQERAWSSPIFVDHTRAR